MDTGEQQQKPCNGRRRRRWRGEPLSGGRHSGRLVRESVLAQVQRQEECGEEGCSNGLLKRRHLHHPPGAGQRGGAHDSAQ